MLFRDADGKPRLKPGITFPRLIAFVVAMIALAILLEHVAEGPQPQLECDARGIDSGEQNVGTCKQESSTLVVVDKHGVLRPSTLEAKLLGLRERKTLRGPAGASTAKGSYLTVDLALTNRTAAPATVAQWQVVLYAAGIRLEAPNVERDYEPRSFLARERAIPPGGTEDGTVVFRSSGKLEKLVREGGNLDFVNLGSAVPADEPEAIFEESEYGVIRTYR